MDFIAVKNTKLPSTKILNHINICLFQNLSTWPSTNFHCKLFISFCILERLFTVNQIFLSSNLFPLIKCFISLIIYFSDSAINSVSTFLTITFSHFHFEIMRKRFLIFEAVFSSKLFLKKYLSRLELRLYLFTVDKFYCFLFLYSSLWKKTLRQPYLSFCCQITIKLVNTLQ